mmetsp:Transcript_6986/g.20788  ORF Transcript_6986/g.20788 Transcript_6986/m.20788 type:complete len:209 (+) Transcript_6986:1389-2015(+)
MRSIRGLTGPSDWPSPRSSSGTACRLRIRPVVVPPAARAGQSRRCPPQSLRTGKRRPSSSSWRGFASTRTSFSFHSATTTRTWRAWSARPAGRRSSTARCRWTRRRRLCPPRRSSVSMPRGTWETPSGTCGSCTAFRSVDLTRPCASRTCSARCPSCGGSFSTPRRTAWSGCWTRTEIEASPNRSSPTSCRCSTWTCRRSTRALCTRR